MRHKLKYKDNFCIPLKTDCETNSISLNSKTSNEDLNKDLNGLIIRTKIQCYFPTKIDNRLPKCFRLLCFAMMRKH